MERAEVSKKNKYYISKHRYYELKHFCLQYKEWKEAMRLLDTWIKNPDEYRMVDVNGLTPANPTEKLAVARAYLSKRIDLIDGVLSELDPSIAKYVKVGVTEGITYDILRIKGCPCCRDLYYEEYRKFFWLLNAKKE